MGVSRKRLSLQHKAALGGIFLLLSLNSEQNVIRMCRRVSAVPWGSGRRARGRPVSSAKARVTAAATSPREDSFPAEHGPGVEGPRQQGCRRAPGEASWSWWAPRQANWQQ